MNIILSFTDQSKSFTYGVEYGRLLERFEKGVEVIENNNFPVSIENKEMLRNTCKAFDYTPVFGDNYYNEWIEFRAIKNSNKN